MKNIEPSSNFPADKMAFLGNGMPNRVPKGGTRNMTGIYLGLEKNANPPRSRTSVPPLARGRGMSMRVRTPTEDRRYKMVELLRVKEEKRGFTGQPVPKPQGGQYPPQGVQYQPQGGQYQPQGMQSPDLTGPYRPPEVSLGSQQSDQLHFAADFWDSINALPRQTPRNFTPATNAGVTHLVCLNPNTVDYITPYDQDAFTVPMINTVAEEVHRVAMTRQDLTGLEECYKKVCKGNIEALYSLLPQRKVYDAKRDRALRYTGFTVKSYRNPNQAVITPPPESRPKTSAIGTRPYVPSPYFFKTYNPPRTGGSLKSRKIAIDDSYLDLGHHSRILAAPGAGILSRSVSRGRQNTSPRLKTPIDAELLQNTPHGKDSPVAPQSTPTVQSAADVTGEGNQAAEKQRSKADSQRPIAVPSAGSSPASEPQSQTQTNTQHPRTPDPSEVSHVEQEASRTQESPTDPANSKEQDDQQDSNPQPAEDPSMALAMSQENANVDTLQVEARPRLPSGPEIIIALEDETGETKAAEIDETDELLATPDQVEEEAEVSTSQGRQRRVSITKRILKARNSEQEVAAQLEEDMNSRKKELNELLDEHAQLVQEVQSMEVHGPLPDGDKENALSPEGGAEPDSPTSDTEEKKTDIENGQ